MNKPTHILLVLTLFLGFGTACTVDKGDGVLLHELSDIEGLNPWITNDASGADIQWLVFESLNMQDFETSQLIPMLADSLPRISTDHLTYEYRLREGIRFSDGSPMTSADIVFAFKTVKNPLIIDAAALRNYYDDVKNVEALDDRRICITMSKPYFLAEFFLGSLKILSKRRLDPQGLTDKYTFAETNNPDNAAANAAMKAFAERMNTPEAKRDPALNIGSGPYVYDEWRTQELLRLRKSRRYWGQDVNPWMRASPPELLYRTIPDRSSAVTALKNNELDFMSFVPATMYDEEVDTSRMTHLAKRTYIMPTYMYIGWNTRRTVLSDKRVRKAFSHLVDRDQLMKQIARGYASPTNTPVYPMRPEYDTTIPAIEYDPAKAAAILAEAGWVDTDGDGTRDKVINGQKQDLSFSFLLNAGNESRERIALFLVDEFKRVGVDVKVQKLEWSVFLENLRTHKFDCYIGAWVNDDIPSDPYQLWHSSQSRVKGSNYVGFVNKRADEIMEANRVEFDPVRREALMHEFQRIVVDEQPYTFLWLQHYPSVYNKRLGNLRFFTIRPGYHPPSWSIAP
ncbi:MAG: hypothetical protein FGM24_02130 [Candidatus Kapabacteria bacterium]|nr:hypothetical protein [Candidatus Kapabacteria bacterium]